MLAAATTTTITTTTVRPYGYAETSRQINYNHNCCNYSHKLEFTAISTENTPSSNRKRKFICCDTDQ